MSDINDRAVMGGNNPPLAEQIALAYAPMALAEEHGGLAEEAGDLAKRAALLTSVNSDEESGKAAELVTALRAMAKRVDDTKTLIKAPVLLAGQNVDAFFNGINNSDTKKAGPVTRQKIRLEAAVRDHAFRVAEAERQRLREAAAAEKRRADQEAEAARLAAEANKPAVANVLLDQAVKSEGFGDRHEAAASGPIQNLARTRTESGVTGLRSVPGFEIQDPEALRATLGPLGNSFTLDAVESAIRKFRSDQPKMEFRDDDQHAYRRVVISVPPLPGVEFFIKYEGNVR